MFRNKEYDALNRMLDDAISGDFREDFFDETELSKFQTRFKRYLTSSSLSEKKLNEEKDKLKELITDISHQTKTPLTNIVMYSELLDEIAEGDPVKEYAGEIRVQSKKLEDLITVLVKLSRLETGIFQFSKASVLVDQIVRKAVDQGYPRAKQKNLSIDVDAASDITILADEKWVTEAVYNILDNAIKYSGSNAAITIRTFSYEMFCGIGITDQGMGISEDEIPKVFSRFYRGRDVRDKEGIGVGLYLAREIVEDHGGYIKISSEVGKGSTFDIYFPNLSTL